MPGLYVSPVNISSDGARDIRIATVPPLPAVPLKLGCLTSKKPGPGTDPGTRFFTSRGMPL
jgi:hypothetical protein